MRVDNSTASPTRDQDMDMILTPSSEPALEKSSVRSLECADNCLNGIKWPPDHRTKSTSGRKRELTIKGLRLNPSLVSHGGRTLKTPARYLESDSDDASSRRKFHSTTKRKRLLSESSRPIKNTTLCKNGRTKSLDRNSCDFLKNHKTKGGIMSPKRKNGERTDFECEIGIDLGSPSTGVARSLSTCSNNSRSQPSESLCVSRTLNDLEPDSETSNSSETPPTKPRRGRPPKNLTQLKKFHSVDSRSPHGNCATSATKASLASPSTSKFWKKRKLSKGIRDLQNNCLSSSSDDNEPAPSTPKRRGRPPKKLLGSCETKHEIFRTQNGVKKPWVRPILKAAEKRSLLKSSKRPLECLLKSPEKFMTKVNSKFVRVNGCRILSSGKEVKRKRGRPPKPKPEPFIEGDRIEGDEFRFTDEDEQKEGTQALKRQLKKLKLQRKEDKSPLAASALKKKAVAQKLRRNALDNAKKNLQVRNHVDMTENEFEPVVETEQSSDVPHKRRRRNKADRILGMRKNVSGTYEYLVQWKDGTSSWAPSNELVDYELDFKCFLGHESQETAVLNRLAFNAYWKDDLIQCHSNQFEIDRLESAEDVFVQLPHADLDKQNTTAPDNESPSCEKQYICKEVSVQKLDEYIHVAINRSSSKQRKINQRILDSLTLVLEDAATDESEFVVISGLGDDTFCGVDLKDLTRVPFEEEPRHYRRDVDKIRYLAQVMIDFPKPVVAALKKPAQGLGAKLVSLCDLVCDEASLGEPVSLQNVSKGRVPYCFTRLMGHTSVNEQILVGHKVPASKLDCVSSASEVFNHTRYTANMSASLKAMTVPVRMVYDDSLKMQHEADSLSELEQQLLQEERKARECIDEIQGLWKDVLSQQV